MTPAVPDSTVEALLAEHEPLALPDGVMCSCNALALMDTTYAAHLASVLAATPDDLRDRLQALCDAAMRNNYHRGAANVSVPVADLLAVLEEDA